MNRATTIVILLLCLGVALADYKVKRKASSASKLLLPKLSRDEQQISNSLEDHLKSEQCITLLVAWEKLERAIRGSRYSNMIVQFEQQVMTLHGVDFRDPDVVEQAFCKMAAIEDLNGLARFLRLPLSTIRTIYRPTVSSIKETRSQWRSFANSAYVSYKDSRVLTGMVDFLDSLEDIGMFSLS